MLLFNCFKNFFWIILENRVQLGDNDLRIKYEKKVKFFNLLPCSLGILLLEKYKEFRVLYHSCLYLERSFIHSPWHCLQVWTNFRIKIFWLFPFDWNSQCMYFCQTLCVRIHSIILLSLNVQFNTIKWLATPQKHIFFIMWQCTMWHCNTYVYQCMQSNIVKTSTKRHSLLTQSYFWKCNTFKCI